jgi:predicted NAD-dependent protein-ADP-ribosyltransferase YbiA (DUF1768 family)
MPPKRKIPIPKDSTQFFRARAKYPGFTFTADGQLQIPSIGEDPPTILPLPQLRRSTVEERAEGDALRKQQLSALEESFDQVTEDYIQAIEAYRETGIISEVIRLQRELARIDQERSANRFPRRSVGILPNPVTRCIFPDLPYEVRHLPHPVYKYVYCRFDLEDYVKEGVLEPAEAVEEEGAKGGGVENEEHYLYFYDASDDATGYLSPEFPIDVVYNSVKYTSILQAYHIERLIQLGRADLKPLLMRSRGVQTIYTVVKGVQGELENPQALWTAVYLAMMKQHPSFAKRLVDTGSDRLVYASPVDAKGGIGLPEEDPASLDPTQWKGTNWLGLALESVRATLREEGGGGGAGEEGEGSSTNATAVGFTEHAKTAQEATQERQQVFMGAARRR